MNQAVGKPSAKARAAARSETIEKTDVQVEIEARRAVLQGGAVQVEPMKSKLKAPGTKRLKLRYDHLLSIFAFNPTCAATARAGD